MQAAPDLGRARRSRTFVSLTGPAGNIGDALIRRAQLDWARGTSDELVVYTGDAPDAWLHQLGVPDDAVVLRSKKSIGRWLRMLLTAPARPALFFEAGEVPLDRGNALRELVFLAETLIVRAKGGVVVRPPRGIRAPTQPSMWLHRRGAHLSQFALWRDATSARLADGDRVVPDIGFAAGIREGNPGPTRREIVVSLRGLRPHPGPEWIEALRRTAAAEDLDIRTVVQVREDEERSRELAAQLGGHFDPWGDADPVSQEHRLRERYSRARLVVSDRMHVLVLGALEGAAPMELVPAPTGKISAAFAAIGLDGISADSAGLGVAAMQGLLRTQLARVEEVGRRVRDAERQLHALEAEVRAAIRKRRS